jgi:OOP family OmpA-OmpF porin
MKPFQGALLGALFFSTAPFALAQTSNVFGEHYTPVPAVSSEQARIVYYRTGAPGQKAPGTNVYVDGEYHGTLLPGGYTTFCVAPGTHGLGNFQQDSPRYAGKRNRIEGIVEGGRTYFMKVRDNPANHAPEAVHRDYAERDLAGAKKQIQTLSRASGVQACRAPAADFDLVADAGANPAVHEDILFGFARSGSEDITTGTDAIATLADQLRRQQAGTVTATGHTDAIGSPAANDRLGAARASTVRRLLISGGVPAHTVRAVSAGSTRPVVECGSSKTPENIACGAINRRVEIQVEPAN